MIVFGPGFGEAIAVHLGDSHWVLVDSCLNAERSAPASAAYLQHIGVAPEQVRAIVASHWHDDHVRGISQLSDAYPQAEFFIPAVFTDKDAAAFLAAYSGSAAPKLAKGASELFKVVSSREVIAAQQRTVLLELDIHGHSVRVNALSPSTQAFAQSVAHFAQYLPTAVGTPINHAPELKPNLEAVVVHIDLGYDSILLGSDLENSGNLGWSALVADNWCGSRPKAGVYKVAHHGSKTGHHDLIWTQLLKDNPKAPMTPFRYGRHKLPNPEDVERIKALSSSAYISSAASRKPEMNSMVVKRLGDICQSLARVNSGFGAIRLRKRISEMDWTVELFGEAQAL